MADAELASEIDELERTLTAIGRGVGRLDNEGRRALVARRRELADRIQRISKLADKVFRGTDDYDLYRRKFSTVRSMTALHQASWPAVSIDPDNPDYVASVQPMRQANRDFIDWMRRKLR